MTAAKRLICALIILALCAGLQVSALTLDEEGLPAAVGEDAETEVSPAADGLSDTVRSEQELEDWLNSHASTGGTVFLSDNITLTSFSGVYFTSKVVINTMQYGLTYDGGSFFTDNLELTGEGVDVPVLTIINPALFRMSWTFCVQPMSVTATGRQSEEGLIGGTAVRVVRDNGWKVNFDFFLEQGLISSYGKNATGMEIDEAIDIYCFNIHVEGENSAAIRAPGGTNIYYSKLSAQGGGSVLASGSGGITLDTCALSPAPDQSGVTVINRKFGGELSRNNRATFLANTDSITVEFYAFRRFQLEGGDEIIERGFLVLWDYDAIGRIDASVTGTTTITGRLPVPFEGLGLTDDFPLEIIIDVRDPAIPCFKWIMLSDDYGDGRTALFEFWDSDAWEVADLILWRSDDEGATWYDDTASDEYKWGETATHNGFDHYFTYTFKEIRTPIWFQLEAQGLGESDIVKLQPDDSASVGGIGGDRTGADRIIGSKPGSKPEPPKNVEPETPPGDEPTSGEDSNSAGKTTGKTRTDRAPNVEAVKSVEAAAGIIDLTATAEDLIFPEAMQSANLALGITLVAVAQNSESTDPQKAPEDQFRLINEPTQTGGGTQKAELRSNYTPETEDKGETLVAAAVALRNEQPESARVATYNVTRAGGITNGSNASAALANRPEAGEIILTTPAPESEIVDDETGVPLGSDPGESGQMQSPFNTGLAMALVACAILVLAILAVLVKTRKLRK